MIKKILKENYIYIIIIILLIITFLIVKNTSLYNKVVNFDYSVIEFMGNHVDKRLTEIFSFLTNFGDWYIPSLIIVCILIFIKNKWYFGLLAGSYSVSGLTVLVSKLIVRRPRPLNALIEIPKSYSFPSGHTLTSIVFYMILWHLVTKNTNTFNRIIFFMSFTILAVLIGFSRVYLGVHFFSDVMGGLILAIPCTLMCINIIDKNFEDKLK